MSDTRKIGGPQFAATEDVQAAQKKIHLLLEERLEQLATKLSPELAAATSATEIRGLLTVALDHALFEVAQDLEERAATGSEPFEAPAKGDIMSADQVEAAAFRAAAKGLRGHGMEERDRH
jgi:hypothetical protein